MGPLFDSPMFCLRIVFEPHVAATSGRLYSLAPSRWRASVLLQPRASSWPHVLTVCVTVEMEDRFVKPILRKPACTIVFINACVCTCTC